jgi:hypothetical protein
MAPSVSPKNNGMKQATTGKTRRRLACLAARKQKKTVRVKISRAWRGAWENDGHDRTMAGIARNSTYTPHINHPPRLPTPGPRVPRCAEPQSQISRAKRCTRARSTPQRRQPPEGFGDKRANPVETHHKFVCHYPDSLLLPTRCLKKKIAHSLRLWCSPKRRSGSGGGVSTGSAEVG